MAEALNIPIIARPKRQKKFRKWPWTRSADKSNGPVLQPPLYGVLDLGTHNCRMLLARPCEGGFRVVDGFSRIVRLGEGIVKTGRLSEAAMERAISALRVCANKLRWWRAHRFRLITTQACRAAHNGHEFVQRVECELGLPLEVIDHQAEAQLCAMGVSPLIGDGQHDAKGVLVFDIGGGSTELMWLAAHEDGYRAKAWTSLPTGVLTMTEKFGSRPARFPDMRESVRPQLLKFAESIHAAGARPEELPGYLLGTSGTVTALASLHMGLRRYNRARVDGRWLTREDIDEAMRKLLHMGSAKRAATIAMGKGRQRSRLMISGCAILAEICDIWPLERLRVADRGLRDGVLIQMMTEDGAYDQNGWSQSPTSTGPSRQDKAQKKQEH